MPHHLSTIFDHSGRVKTLGTKKFIETFNPFCFKELLMIPFDNPAFTDSLLRQVLDEKSNLYFSSLYHQFVWQNQIPVHLIDVPDGTKVSFDATFIPEINSYLLILCWIGLRPSMLYIPISGSDYIRHHYVNVPTWCIRCYAS